MAQGLTGAIVDSAISYPSLAAAGSITLGNNDWHVVVLTNPTGTIATGTITMCPAPRDGQLVDIRADGTITTLTVAANSGQTITGAPATLVLGTVIQGIYRTSNTKWYF